MSEVRAISRRDNGARGGSGGGSDRYYFAVIAHRRCCVSFFPLRFGAYTVGLISFWMLWFLRSSFVTGRRLKSLPYLASRHRQLSYRMFLFMTYCMIVFVLSVLVIRVFYSSNLQVDSHDAPLPTCCLYAVYIWLVCYIYQPLPPPALELPPPLPAQPSLSTLSEHALAQPLLDPATNSNTNAVSAAAAVSVHPVGHPYTYGAVADSPGHAESSAWSAAVGAPVAVMDGLLGGLSSVGRFLTKQVRRVGQLVGMADDDELVDGELPPMAHFSWHTAKWMCRFAWEGYYDPPDVAQYGFDIVAALVDVPSDTYGSGFVLVSSTVISVPSHIVLIPACFNLLLVCSFQVRVRGTAWSHLGGGVSRFGHVEKRPHRPQHDAYLVAVCAAHPSLAPATPQAAVHQSVHGRRQGAHGVLVGVLGHSPTAAAGVGYHPGSGAGPVYPAARARRGAHHPGRRSAEHVCRRRGCRGRSPA